MKKTLVAYFSAGGVTKRLAEKLAAAADADIYEIEPAVRYTDADLDWTNSNSRSSVEMADRASRPAIKDKLPDMSGYDRIFVGFPVWWYREPSIIDTFMENADLGGKKVIPFATSGGSGIGDSGKNMQAVSNGAKVEQGKRFAASVSESELKAWAAKF